MNKIKRIAVDLLLLMLIVAVFAFRLYEILPAPLQLIALKILLVSAGIIHAHIARKLLFETIVWNATTLTGGHYVAIAFYITIPICYAISG